MVTFPQEVPDVSPGIDRPALFIARLAPLDKRRWLPLPLAPHHAPMLENWLRARVHDAGGYLIGTYLSWPGTGTHRFEDASLVIMFEVALPVFQASHSTPTARSWGSVQTYDEVASLVKGAIESGGSLEVSEPERLHPSHEFVPVFPGP